MTDYRMRSIRAAITRFEDAVHNYVCCDAKSNEWCAVTHQYNQAREKLETLIEGYLK